ncbi:hypothetical protein PFISCL1PPCAC_8938, partial [Pristionchus fissidentatus]
GITQQREDRKLLRSIERNISVASDSDHLISRSITIPAMIPLHFHCPNISVTYRLKVKVMTSRILGESVSVNVPITIGSIGLRKELQNPGLGRNSADLPSYEECVGSASPTNLVEDGINLQITPWR